MRLMRIIASSLATVVLAATLTACGTTQLQEATVAYVDTPQGIAEAQESWDIDTASDEPDYTAENTVAKKSKKPRYIEVIWDEGQRTHWENGGLVVGTYGHALAACQDGRFLPKSEHKACIAGAYEWAKNTHQKTKGVGPVTLPKQPVKKSKA